MDKIPEYLEQKYNMHPFDSERVKEDEIGYWQTFLIQTDHIPLKISEAYYLSEEIEDYSDVLEARKLCREKINFLNNK